MRQDRSGKMKQPGIQRSNTVLINSWIKSTLARFSLLEAVYSLRELPLSEEEQKTGKELCLPLTSTTWKMIIVLGTLQGCPNQRH
jgi:hypothetical protein